MSPAENSQQLSMEGVQPVVKVETKARPAGIKNPCKYGRGNCHKEAAIKDNGLPHKFCEYHRQQANRIQRAVRRRKRAIMEAQVFVTDVPGASFLGDFGLPDAKLRKVQSEPTLGSMASSGYIPTATLCSDFHEGLSEEFSPTSTNLSTPPTDTFSLLDAQNLLGLNEDDFLFEEIPRGFSDNMGLKGSMSLCDLSALDKKSAIAEEVPLAPAVAPALLTTAPISMPADQQVSISQMNSSLEASSSKSIDELAMNKSMFFFDLEEDLLAPLPLWGSDFDALAA